MHCHLGTSNASMKFLDVHTSYLQVTDCLNSLLPELICSTKDPDSHHIHSYPPNSVTLATPCIYNLF
jgi:hypothetical protein